MTETDGRSDLSRRSFIWATSGSAAAAAGGASTVSAQEENGTENGGEDGSTETLTVGPGGENVFEPASLAIEPGTTVEFVWDSDTHNMVVENGPSEWGGHESIESAGFSYEHTFEEEGTYEYICEPHVAAGMEGTLSVEEGASSGGGGGASATPTIPDSAMSLAVGTMGAMVSTIALAYFFIKYGGYDEELE
ncbi:plastocyanin/azurin family copper-binding protein [Natronoarchaeum sp. GCM10025321]|uniref:plastocyanin/azurin family copper-binding protein n=2 Tax=unclassified Natronoarchaeum TaxID=2620183 RepID=UPI0036218D9E